LNGGYTVGEWTPLFKLFWESRTLTSVTDSFANPTQGQQFTKGDKIRWMVTYIGHLQSQPLSWFELGNIDSNRFDAGNQIIKAGYGATASVSVVIKSSLVPSQIICHSELENRTLPVTSGIISEEMHLPLWINIHSGVFKQRLNNQVQYNEQDGVDTHPTSFPDFFQNLTTPALTINNINNPWINPKDGKYWTMSIGFGAFDKAVKEKDHEKYYMNMRWDYYQFPDLNVYQEKDWFFGKKIWIKNPATGKAIIAGILDNGPAESTGSVAGASPEVLKAIGAQHGSAVEFCWADQDSAYGSVVGY